MMASELLEHESVSVELPPDGGFLRQPQVLRSIPVSRSTLWRWVKAGTFPAPVKLSVHVSAWRVADVRRWITERTATGGGRGW